MYIRWQIGRCALCGNNSFGSLLTTIVKVVVGLSPSVFLDPVEDASRWDAPLSAHQRHVIVRPAEENMRFGDLQKLLKTK